MEQEFKNRMLAYLAGDYQTETGNTNLNYFGATQPTTNVFKTISNMSGTQTGTAKSYDGQYLIVYGTYDSESKGFIALCKNNFDLIKLFTEYEGRTQLPPIYYLSSAEDGTFYGVVKQNNTSYLLILNNFTLTLNDEYKLKFRQSYELSSELQNSLYQYHGAKVFKKQGEARYIFVAPREVSSSTSGGSTTYKFSKFIISFLHVQVGTENEWENYVFDTNITLGVNMYSNPEDTATFDTYASWTNDNFYVKIAGDEFGYSKRVLEYSMNNSTTINTVETILNDYFTLGIRGHGNIIIKDFTNTYIGTLISGDRFGYSVFKVVNGNYSEIYHHDYLQDQGYSDYGYLTISNQILMFRYYTTYEGTSVTGIIFNDIVYEFPIIYYDYNSFELTQFNLTNSYNLYTFTMGDAFSTYPFARNFIFNINNYNGTSYQNLNSMIPNSAVLLDDNGKTIFARNLYNVSINQNTTESTLEIPNTYLNDNIINTQNLYSQTNSLLNSNEQSIEKNIYETLYINFFNTINIKNANDPNNVIINIPGASRLNGSISGQNSYNNVKIGNIRITYTDNTNLDINEFELTKNSDTSYTIGFSILVGKAIQNIKIMSEDKMTTYQTITPSLEIGKLYNITQDVRIV